MSIAIVSDIHLGRRNYRRASKLINDIERLGYEQWDKIIKDVIKNKPEYFIIAGDLFHSNNPTSLSINKAKEGFLALSKNGIKTYVVAGNHEFSHQNRKLNSHLFSIFDGLFEHVTFVYKEPLLVEEKDYDLTLFPHYQFKLNSENKIDKNEFNMLLEQYSKDLSDKKKHVFVGHGVVESWIYKFNKNNEEDANNNLLYLGTTVFPDKFVNKFDNFVLGHIHNSFEQLISNEDGTKCRRIAPGSTMEDNEGSFKVDSEEKKIGVIYLDPKTDKLTRHSFSSVNIYKYNFKSREELNDFLQNIEFNIYYVKYEGKWEDIDNDLYQEALSKSLYLSIKLEDLKLKNNLLSSVKPFWEWASDNVSQEDYLEMKNIVKEG